MVRDGELPPDEFGDSRARPDLAAEAVCLRAVREQLGYQRALGLGQLGGGPQMRAGRQCLIAPLAHEAHPLADGGGRDGEGFGDLLLPPASALQRHRAAAAEFFPIG